jgi:protein TonB
VQVEQINQTLTRELSRLMRAFTLVVMLAALATPAAVHAQAGKAGGPNQDQPYFEFQVEKPVLARDGNPHPRYPASLQNRGVNGEVLAQFVVDTTGRADVSTFEVLKSSDEAFTRSVREVLPRLRFYPAEVGGRKVKQLVQQSFLFVASR